MRQFTRQTKTKQSYDASIPQFIIPGFKKFMKRTGLNVIKVPIRLNGLTSSGKSGRCYYNVENLVELFGGKVVVGWCVSHHIKRVFTVGRPEFRNTIVLHSHAVWMNDEGKLSDPTAKSWMTDGIYEDGCANAYGLIEEKGKMYTKFIPLKSSTIDDNFGCNTITISFLSDENLFIKSQYTINILFSQQGDVEFPLKFDDIDGSLIEEMILYRYDWKKHFSTLEDFHRFRHKEGNFSEKSLATGRTLQEIRNNRLLKSVA